MKATTMKRTITSVLVLLLAVVGLTTTAATSTAQTTPPPTWNQLGTDLIGENARDVFGRAVAVSADGNTIVVGAPHNGDVGDSAGQAQVHRFNGTDWVQLGTDINGERAGDEFGAAVAISADGDTVIIGAPYNGDNGIDSGHARIYQYDGTDWTQLGTDINGESPEDNSGWSVAMSADGHTVIIGAPYNDNANGIGHARTYRFTGTDWTQLGQDLDSERLGRQSGWSVAMSDDGNTVIIGAPFNSKQGFNGWEGHARIYQYDGSRWTRVHPDIDGEHRYDRSGWSVAMSADGNTVIVGAPFNDGNGPRSGHARVFRHDGTDWIQLGTDIDAERYDWSGRSVAMSADGNTVVVGVPGLFDARNGRARIYQYNGADWTQVGTDFDGDNDDDSAGWSVAMSADGATIVVGAPFAASNGSASGQVRVFTTRVACGGAFPTIDMTTGASGVGTPRDDVIVGTSGPDQIDGGGGDDIICGGGGVDRILGGDGDDSIFGDGGSDRIFGGPGNDVISGGSGADRIFGQDGDDTINGAGGQDRIYGGNGDDLIQGSHQSDRLLGNDGNDTIGGANGKDTIIGGDGNDILNGGDNTDTLKGGDGTDTLNGQRGNDNCTDPDPNTTTYTSC